MTESNFHAVDMLRMALRHEHRQDRKPTEVRVPFDFYIALENCMKADFPHEFEGVMVITHVLGLRVYVHEDPCVTFITP